MSLLRRINELAKDSLIESKLLKEEGNPDKIKKYVDKLLKKVAKSDKTDLCQMSNFEIFFMFLILTNEKGISFDETYEYCKEVKRAVNSWTFDKDKDRLLEMQNGTAYDGSLIDFALTKTLTELGLTPVFVNYNMKVVYMCMYDFLKLKKDILNPQEYTRNLPFRQRLLIMDKIYKQSRFSRFVEAARQCLERDITNYEYRKNILQKRIDATNEVIAMLNEGALEEIYEFPSEWHQYLKPDLLELIYEIVLNNLTKQRNEAELEEKSMLSKKDKSSLTTYLYNNGLNPYSLAEKLEELENIPNILNKIEFFKSLDIPLNNVLTKYYNYLISITDEQIKKLDFLIRNRILLKSTLKNNFNRVNNEYQRIIANYEILKGIIDFDNIFYNDKILFKDIKEIKNIISILKEYKLTKNNYIFLLCNFEYIGIYDLIIENDIPESLFISICETANPLNTIKRILIYKSIGEEYETPSHFLKKDVISESKFICGDEMLDYYVPNIVSLYGMNMINGEKISTIKENPLVQKLDSEYQVDNIYLFGNVMISRPKFLRNFESVGGNSQLLVASLVSHSILDEASYYEIITELTSKQLKK